MQFGELSVEEYRNFVENSDQWSFLNSYEALVLKKTEGWDAYLVGLKDSNGAVKGAALVASLPVRHTSYRFFYVQKGPVLDYQDKELVKSFSDGLVSFCRKQKALYILADPYVLNVERDIDGNVVEGGFDHSYAIENLVSYGWEHKPLTTAYDTYAVVRYMFVLGMKDKDEKTLLAQMDQAKRYSIQRAIKEGTQVREMTRDELPLFAEMMKDTAERRGFESRGLSYYQELFDAYGEHVKFLLAYVDLDTYLEKLNKEKEKALNNLASAEEKLKTMPENKKALNKKKENETVLTSLNKKITEAEKYHQEQGRYLNLTAGCFTCYPNEVLHLFGANDDTYWRFGGSYAIQWYMMQYALKNGIPRYNFYGISGNFDKDAQDYGVYSFKRGFGGTVEEMIGDFIYPVHPHLYSLYRKLRKH